MSKELKHTKWPWTFSEQKRYGKGYFQAQIFDSKGKSIACFDVRRDSNSNAKLACSAPDLLQTLISLKESMQNMYSVWGYDVLEDLEIIETAINKATS